MYLQNFCCLFLLIFNQLNHLRKFNKLSIIEYEDDEEDDTEEYKISIKGKTLTMKYEYEWTFYFDKKKHTRSAINTLTKR